MYQVTQSRSQEARLRSCVVQDIISKRNITRTEMEGINPSVDLDNLEPNQVGLPPAPQQRMRRAPGRASHPLRCFRVCVAMPACVNLPPAQHGC